ncbi:hypothetical protein HSR121_1249 [Halapricum desulfuricans]|uniref:Uncharacterized protein n=1 Tax=Halapricum desulfuricans TaxID=2841257 RepID=A0A897N454_9EURY|nr:hypothetical protein HSR121_1249 [Halapricum desulfuricans]
MRRRYDDVLTAEMAKTGSGTPRCTSKRMVGICPEKSKSSTMIIVLFPND